MNVRLIETDDAGNAIRQLWPAEGSAAIEAPAAPATPAAPESVVAAAAAPVAPTEPADNKPKCDTMAAFVAKGPAQQSYRDMLAKVLGTEAGKVGHVNLPEDPASGYRTLYCFRTTKEHLPALAAKLAASEYASHFEPEPVPIETDQAWRAQMSVGSGELPEVFAA